jgi:hypothetical protein
VVVAWAGCSVFRWTGLGLRGHITRCRLGRCGTVVLAEKLGCGVDLRNHACSQHSGMFWTWTDTLSGSRISKAHPSTHSNLLTFRYSEPGRPWRRSGNGYPADKICAPVALVLS